MTTQLKLGRIKSPGDHRDLKLAVYSTKVPDPPAKVNYLGKSKSWAVLGNDKAGDCVEAGVGHLIQAITLTAAGHRARITTAIILAWYERLTGYVPGDPSTDNGTNMRDALKDWAKHPLNNHSLNAFAAVDIPKIEERHVVNDLDFRTGLWLFGGLVLGLDLPLTAKYQFSHGQPWTVGSGAGTEPDSWGGHCVYAGALGPDGIECLTWGTKHLMTWDFLATYCSESYACITADWLSASKSPPASISTSSKRTLAALRSAA